MYIKGFIANLEKHLEGELIGEWITFPISEEELNEVLKRIGIGENNYICPIPMRKPHGRIRIR